MGEKGQFFRFFGARSKFVYYNSLSETHPDIYGQLIAEKQLYGSHHNIHMQHLAEQLRRMASAEGAKEVSLLKEFFNVTSLSLGPEDMYSKSIGKEIVDSVNTALSFKNAYERHLKRITQTKHAKISAAQFFADYFTKNLLALVTARIPENIGDYSAETLGEYLFADEVINQALEGAFFGTTNSLKESGDLRKNDEDKGYQELFGAIENFNKTSFLQEVAQAYKLDQLRDELMRTISSSDELKSKLTGKGAKTFIKKSLKESTTAKGTLNEIIGEKVAAAIAGGMEGAGVQVEFSSKVVGKAGGKADFIMSFGLDMSKILDVVNKHYQGREETVEAYKGLNEYLRKMNGGFIVYTNAKEYSLIESKGDGKYFFDGFSAGSPISLGTLEGIIQNTPGGSADLIGQIMNTMEGAIYSGDTARIEAELCSKMAYFLFDDVLTIGKPTAASGHAIHLMYLNGVYVPLSYMFYLLADAIEDVSQDPRDIFDITINSGSIKYPNPPWEPGMWYDQKITACEQIEISAKFLKSFRDVITGLRI